MKPEPVLEAYKEGLKPMVPLTHKKRKYSGIAAFFDIAYLIAPALDSPISCTK
jgi:hypothetical protein